MITNAITLQSVSSPAEAQDYKKEPGKWELLLRWKLRKEIRAVREFIRVCMLGVILELVKKCSGNPALLPESERNFLCAVAIGRPDVRLVETKCMVHDGGWIPWSPNPRHMWSWIESRRTLHFVFDGSHFRVLSDGFHAHGETKLEATANLSIVVAIPEWERKGSNLREFTGAPSN